MTDWRSRFFPLAASLTALLAGCGGSGGGDSGNRGDEIGGPAPVAPEPQGPIVARQWSGLLLEAIRNDFARPTYRDAADQTSLSRIWGGIHPPADDIPGRRIGERVGQDAFARARQHFNGTL